MDTEVALGQKFGKWKVAALRYYNSDSEEHHILVRCECGTLGAVAAQIISSGKSTSCGCDQVKPSAIGTKRKRPAVLKSWVNFTNLGK